MSRPVRVMGIVNVTPDSFSDGGMYFRPEEAARRALNLAKDGADILDLGGESTRPGATPLAWEEEWSRLEPVFAALTASSRQLPALSVDTYHPETAERALAAGARIVNCVYAEAIPEMTRVVTRRPGASLVAPAACFPTASDVAALPFDVYLDPMIGFGTTREEDLALIRGVSELAKRGHVLVGASRKRIVKKLTGVKVAGKDLAGNLALALWCARHGAEIVRVHDVFETVQALRVDAVLGGL